jgi:hypothetical protein
LSQNICVLIWLHNSRQPTNLPPAWEENSRNIPQELIMGSGHYEKCNYLQYIMDKSHRRQNQH